ncbi:MAG: FecR domain-containing protein [Pollutimonas bauzanensis]
MSKPAARTAPVQRGPAQAPIDAAIVQKAAQWMARLWADDASAAEHAACAQWRAAHPDHERAWRRLQALDDKLQDVPQHAARVLDPAATNTLPRRRALQVLGLAAIATGAIHTARNSESWRILSSDYSTKVGEIREVVLADGTRVVLNTASAIDVRFDGAARDVILRSGEALVTTGRDSAAPARPFTMRSRQGAVRALGTRFMLRQDDDVSHVAVFHGAVEVLPAHALEAPLRLDAGEGTSFSDTHVHPRRAALERDLAWSQGLLIAENMRVQDFLREVGRYRQGLLRCSPEVADMRITGVFPLADTDRALANLKLALPVELAYRTRYWVTVQAR